MLKFLDGALRDKVHFTGNPVRDIVIEQAATPYPSLRAPWPSNASALLVFGGSQGARFFSETVPAALDGLDDDTRAASAVTQQCRAEDIDAVRTSYGACRDRCDCETFFADLPRIIAASHLVIARAGASTVAELTVIGRPSILVPLPHSLDNDQLQNATSLAEAGGAICIAQSELDRRPPCRSKLTRIMTDPTMLARAAATAKAAGRPDAVRRLADLVEQLAAEE